MTTTHWRNTDVHLILEDTYDGVNISILGKDPVVLASVKATVQQELEDEHIEIVPTIFLYRRQPHPILHEEGTVGKRRHDAAGVAFLHHAVEHAAEREHLTLFQPDYHIKYEEWKTSINMGLIALALFLIFLVALPIGLARQSMLENHWFSPWWVFSSSAEPFLFIPLIFAGVGLLSWRRYHTGKLRKAVHSGDAILH